MFTSINKTFGCCSKIFGCSNKNLFVVPNFVAVTKQFFSCKYIQEIKQAPAQPLTIGASTPDAAKVPVVASCHRREERFSRANDFQVENNRQRPRTIFLTQQVETSCSLTTREGTEGESAPAQGCVRKKHSKGILSLSVMGASCVRQMKRPRCRFRTRTNVGVDVAKREHYHQITTLIF